MNLLNKEGNHVVARTVLISFDMDYFLRPYFAVKLALAKRLALIM